jgi:hypothetical protein
MRLGEDMARDRASCLSRGFARIRTWGGLRRPLDPAPLFGALPVLLFCWACSSSSTELLAVKGARSIVSEWELVNREAASGRLTRVYADGMRSEAISQLRSEVGAISNTETPTAREITRISNLPGDASPEILHQAVLRLLAIEDQLGPA